MSLLPVLPALPGQTWPVDKTAIWKTKISSHVSGKEVRTSLWSYPLYEFEVRYDGLSSARPDTGSERHQGLVPGSKHIMLGFFNSMRGQGGQFLFQDFSDCVASGQELAVGDGSETRFRFVRTLSGWTEPVGHVAAVSSVYINGSPTSDYDVVDDCWLQLGSALPSGATVSADYHFRHVCRFMEDRLGLSEFLDQIWELRSLKFRSVRS